MKKLIFAFIAMLFVPATQAASEFKEGVEYTVISEAPGSKPDVMEFFSYICPHCYSFQPLMEQLEERMPDAEISKVPVGFLGKDLGPVLQRAYGAAKLLNVEDKMTPVMFDRIHRQKKVPGSLDDVKEVFVANGVDAKDFDGVISSFALNGMIAKYDRMTEKYEIRGTPTLIVRGKYLLNMGEIGSEERFYRVVEYLVSAD